MSATIRFLSRRAAGQALGRSIPSLYRDIDTGVLTRPVSLGLRAVGWPAHEIDAIARARLAGASLDRLRALVDRLHQQRTQADDSANQAA